MTGMENMMQELIRSQEDFKAQVRAQVEQDRLHAAKMNENMTANMSTMQETMVMNLMKAMEGMRVEPRRTDRRGRVRDRVTRELSLTTDTSDNDRERDRSEGPSQRRRGTHVDEVMSVGESSESEWKVKEGCT